MEEDLEGEHFKPHFRSRPGWFDQDSVTFNPNTFSSCKALDAFVKARYMLDFTPYVSLEDIAILAGVSRRTVTNATGSHDSDKALELASEFSFQNSLFGTYDHIVEAESARTWLCKRYMFHETTEKGTSSIRVRHQALSYLDKINPDETIYTVPQARDGSLFSPSCGSQNGYTVGPKESEIQFADFEKALEHLSRIEKPYWRRRNEKGRLGIVAGVAWIEVPKSTLFPK